MKRATKLPPTRPQRPRCATQQRQPHRPHDDVQGGDQVSRAAEEVRVGQEVAEVVLKRVVRAEAERFLEPADPVFEFQGVHPAVVSQRLAAVGGGQRPQPRQHRQGAGGAAGQPAGPGHAAAVEQQRPQGEAGGEEEAAHVDLAHADDDEAPQEGPPPAPAFLPAAQHQHRQERQHRRRPDLPLQQDGQRVDGDERGRPQPRLALRNRHHAVREPYQNKQTPMLQICTARARPVGSCTANTFTRPTNTHRLMPGLGTPTLDGIPIQERSDQCRTRMLCW